MVSTVTLKPERRLPNFKPGQFLHLALDPFDPTIGFWPESRVFSIASIPSENIITIAYAIKGSFTRRMRTELTIGKEIWIRLPYGHFTVKETSNEEIVLVAGGTGITPFISFIANELVSPSGLSLKLLYGVRRPKLFLFRDILARAMDDLEDFTLLAFSEERSNDDYPFQVGEGSLALEKVWQAANRPLDATYYLAGPVAMINTFKAGLRDKGVPQNKIQIDEWE